MRTRIAFKLSGEEADLARELESLSGVSIDKIAKMAMLRYMDEVLKRAQAMQKEAQSGQSPDPVHPSGAVPPAQDALLSQEG